jgi:hypothetical protein
VGRPADNTRPGNHIGKHDQRKAQMVHVISCLNV